MMKSHFMNLFIVLKDKGKINDYHYWPDYF